MKKNLFENAKMELILFGSDVVTTSYDVVSEPGNVFYEPNVPSGKTDQVYEAPFTIY
jgi:hypothetical protein